MDARGQVWVASGRLGAGLTSECQRGLEPTWEAVIRLDSGGAEPIGPGSPSIAQTLNAWQSCDDEL